MMNLRRNLIILAGLAALPILISLGLPLAAVSNSISGHRSINCVACHSVVRSKDSGPSASSGIVLNTCSSCHTSESLLQNAFSGSFHVNESRACTSCHGIHEGTLRAGERVFAVSLTESTAATVCGVCHTLGEEVIPNKENLSEGHKGALEIFHSERAVELNETSASPSAVCFECHSEQANAQSASMIAGVNSVARVVDEHGSHPVGIEVELGSGFPGARIRENLDSRISLFDGKIECQTCHSMLVGNTFREKEFPVRSDLCQGCHKLD